MFSFFKKADSQAAEITALKRQLESAKRRISELTLEKIQLENEIVTLENYRGAPVPEAARPILAIGKEMIMPALAANSQIGRLFTIAG